MAKPTSFDWKFWSAVTAAVVSVFLSPFILDVDVGVFASLGVLAVFALWWVWTVSPFSHNGRKLATAVIIVVTISWGGVIYCYSRPHFEITALKTLDGDRNAYELTDMLIWNQDVLDEYDVDITFVLEIRPIYYGKQRFGKVVALISGEGDDPTEKALWDDFTKTSSTQQVELTLSEILGASGLKLNTDPPSNVFGSGDLPFQQAKLTVQIARAARRTRTWDKKEITLRNAPWEFRSDLVWRNDQREVDVYVKNLGGPGWFTVRYKLVRLEKEISSSSHVMGSGATYVDAWNKPVELYYVKKGEFFTDTSSLPSDLAPGRYFLEVYPVKKQNYVQFKDPGTAWESLNSMKSPWWFSGLSGPMRYQRLAFVVTTSEFPEDATILAERDRLRDEQGIDLGLPTGLVETVTSPTGTEGRRQVFQEGEIYIYHDQAYALYGPILEHYRELGGVQNEWLGFPISQVQTVTSSSGAEGTTMEFEGPGSPHASTLIYASRKGVAAMWMWIRGVYAGDHGGHSGWLGFPLADEQGYADSTVQMFEHGYIVYHYPYVEGERDWGLEPIAFPYLASHGTLFAVHAQQLWQDTGVQVQAGDQVTIVQVGGSWTNREVSEEPFDANGNADIVLQEDAVLPPALIGTLIGRIGQDDGHVFSVGRWGVHAAPVEGSLYLAMNDNNHEDNAGFITVQIMVEH